MPAKADCKNIVLNLQKGRYPPKLNRRWFSADCQGSQRDQTGKAWIASSSGQCMVSGASVICCTASSAPLGLSLYAIPVKRFISDAKGFRAVKDGFKRARPGLPNRRRRRSSRAFGPRPFESRILGDTSQRSASLSFGGTPLGPRTAKMPYSWFSTLNVNRSGSYRFSSRMRIRLLMVRPSRS